MTKLRLEQLPRHLQGTLRPVYFISGDEILLVQESCDAVRQAARRAGFSERERYDIDQQTEWPQLLSAAKSRSLFHAKKLIECHSDSSHLGDGGGRAITAYLADPSDDNMLLMVTPKLKAAQQRSRWLQAIVQRGIWLPIWPLDSVQFRRWIIQRLKASQLRADNAAIDILVERTEGNLVAAAQDIEKLALLATDGVVSASLMAGAVADSARFNVFDLIDKALLGDASGAARCLQGLKSEGIEIPMILWGLTRELRHLSTIQQAVDNGQSPAKAFSDAGVWDKRKYRVQQGLDRLSAPQLRWLLRRASAIDKAVKGVRDGDAWGELLDLVLNLAGVQATNLANQRLALSGSGSGSALS